MFIYEVFTPLVLTHYLAQKLYKAVSNIQTYYPKKKEVRLASLKEDNERLTKEIEVLRKRAERLTQTRMDSQDNSQCDSI